MSGSDDNFPQELLNLQSAKDVKEFLEGPTVAIAEFLTGILSHGPWPSSFVVSAGRLVQSSVKGKLFTQFGRELKKYQEEGKIKEDYFATHKNQVTLLELLQFIDGEIPDEEVFSALKSIFFTGVAKDAGQEQENVSYQLLQLCKKLNSMDILILKACYQIYSKPHHEFQEVNAFGDWVNIVSDKIGYGLPELVGAEDTKLVDLGLLSRRTYADLSGISKGQNFRLTTLAIKLCEHVTAFPDRTDA